MGNFSFQVGLDDASDLMKLAYENGVNFFDNAEAYASGESEIIMGKVLKNHGWSRDSYVISSKVFWEARNLLNVGLVISML